MFISWFSPLPIDYYSNRKYPPKALVAQKSIAHKCANQTFSLKTKWVLVMALYGSSKKIIKGIAEMVVMVLGET
jgi:hypothetical protein